MLINGSSLNRLAINASSAVTVVPDEGESWFDGFTRSIITVLATAAAVSMLAVQLPAQNYQDDLPAATLYGQAEEELWQNPTPPVPLSFARLDQWTLEQNEIPVPVYENLLRHSEEIGSSPWTLNQATITPDVSGTRDKLVPDAVIGSFSETAQVIATLDQNTDHTLSVDIKSDAYQWAWLLTQDYANSLATTWFDSINGVVGTSQSGHVATITSLGGGVFRVSVRFNTNSGVTAPTVYFGISGIDGTHGFNPNGVDGIDFGRAQLNRGAYASAYIRTDAPPLQIDEWTNPIQPIQLSFFPLRPWDYEQNEQAAGLYNTPVEKEGAVLPAPVQLTFIQPRQWEFEQGEQAFGLYGLPVEKEIGVFPAPVQLTFIPLPQWFWEQNDQATGLYGIPVEVEGPILPAPIPLTFLQPRQWEFEQGEQATGLYGQPDEDFWVNPTASVPLIFRVPQPWIWEQNEQATGLQGQSEEELWQNSAAPVVQTFVRLDQWTFDVQEPAGKLFGQYDEDFWAPVVIPSVVRTIQAFIVEDEITTTPIVVEESEWIVTIVSAPFRITLPTTTDDEIVAQPTLAVGEDFWTNPVAPISQSFARLDQSIFDVQEPAGNLYGLPIEKADWIIPIPAKVSLILQPFAIEDDLPVTAVPTVVDDSDGWQSQVVPFVLSFVQPRVWEYDQGEQATGLYGILEEQDFQVIVPQTLSKIGSAFASDDELPVLTVDESEWNVFVPQVVQTQKYVFTTDDDYISSVGIPEEQEWNVFVPKLTSYVQYQFSIDDIYVALIVEEQDWKNPALLYPIQVVQAFRSEDEVVPVSVPSGSLVLTGYPPQLIGRILSSGAEQLWLIGYAPVILEVPQVIDQLGCCDDTNLIPSFSGCNLGGVVAVTEIISDPVILSTPVAGIPTRYCEV